MQDGKGEEKWWKKSDSSTPSGLYPSSNTPEGEFDGPLETTYSGIFVKGKKQGEGEVTWADGSSYRGQFEDNLINGVGIFT